MESRVGVLDVRIRAAGEPSPALVSATRGFACRVLERCDEILEQRAPGRLVFMRYLEMQWRLWERGVESADEVEAVAREMAGALDEQARACPAIPDAQAEIVVFDDEVHYRAEYLRAVAERRAEQCWFFEKLLDEGAAPGILGRSEHRELTEAVLTKLTSDGILERVLAGLSRTAVDDLARVLAIAGPLPIGITGDSPLVALHRAVARFAGADSRGSPRTHTPRARRDAAGLTPDDARDADYAAALPVPPADASEIDGVETAFGGLFYLLTPALELSLGEVLWRACLPETAVFTRLAEAILGAEASADPASRLFGGAALDTSLPAVTEEQHGEVAKATLAAMVDALSRRPTTELPSVRLSLAAVATRRLLVAAPIESPFAMFAWPADAADALTEGLGTFLAHWPANAPPPAAHPALASLDRSARIRTTRSAGAPSVLLPEHDDLLATALLAQAAGSLAFLFAARAGAADISSPALLVERYLSVPARVVVADDEMEIRMPLERIDLAIRRAGLDRDPGWVPWLQKHVRFVFGGDVERP